MNVSMGQLVNDAKELVMRLKEREKNVDLVVIQSNALAKKVDAIQQLENELMSINEKSNHRSKVAVLSSIQKENKVIKLLQQENEDLKESLEEHQSVLEVIMSKYRQQMLQLIRIKKQQELIENFYRSAIFKSLQEKTDQIAEMTDVMKHAIELDEKAVNENEERLQSLLVENKGLKELLKIKTKFGVKEEYPNLIDKEIQTDEILSLSELNSVESNPETNLIAPFKLDETITIKKELEEERENKLELESNEINMLENFNDNHSEYESNENNTKDPIEHSSQTNSSDNNPS